MRVVEPVAVVRFVVGALEAQAFTSAAAKRPILVDCGFQELTDRQVVSSGVGFSIYIIVSFIFLFLLLCSDRNNIIIVYR